MKPKSPENSFILLFQRLSLRDDQIRRLVSDRNDFEPVAIRVRDEVYTHFFIFVADTAHLFVQGVRGLKILSGKGDMNLVVCQIVGFPAVFEPGDLQLM